MVVSGRLLLVVGLGSCVAGVTVALLLAPSLMARGQAHPVSPIDPRPVLEPWVEGQITVDARDRSGWTYFDFSRGSVVTDARTDGHNWDLAFQRYYIATNGGTTNPHGFAAATKVGRERPLVAPPPGDDGWVLDDWEHQTSHNQVFRRWFRYSPLENGLVSRGDYFVIRTADHGYAWMQLVAYYCPPELGGGAGCVTFRYGYRADFSRELPGEENDERHR
jgi:hypothetical protein